eukprot:scaffold244831_cov25-Prasinocladus_malaysianus.AAC.1
MAAARFGVMMRLAMSVRATAMTQKPPAGDLLRVLSGAQNLAPSSPFVILRASPFDRLAPSRCEVLMQQRRAVMRQPFVLGTLGSNSPEIVPVFVPFETFASSRNHASTWAGVAIARSPAERARINVIDPCCSSE